jgi:N-acetylglucosaminyldiphosphoundecaprenol N-acetyl-beta-D-mannosaminyltransferase
MILSSVVKFPVLGVGIHAVDVDSTVECLADVISFKSNEYVCITGVHGVVEAMNDAGIRGILNSALLNVPDGMPLVWVGRILGFKQTGRVYGPDLMLKLCERSIKEGGGHFLYGGKPGIVEDLKAILECKFPGIRIVGTYCPPFRPLNDQEEQELIDTVARVKPDLFWVGLSTPKQERFMADYSSKLDTKVMLGVGAAFDLHTGRMKDAPSWVKRAGLQWLHRFCQEPLRLGKRYLKIVPVFIVMETLELMGLAKFNRRKSDEVEVGKIDGEKKGRQDNV